MTVSLPEDPHPPDLSVCLVSSTLNTADQCNPRILDTFQYAASKARLWKTLWPSLGSLGSLALGKPVRCHVLTILKQPQDEELHLSRTFEPRTKASWQYPTRNWACLATASKVTTNRCMSKTSWKQIYQPQSGLQMIVDPAKVMNTTSDKTMSQKDLAQLLSNYWTTETLNKGLLFSVSVWGYFVTQQYIINIFVQPSLA